MGRITRNDVRERARFIRKQQLAGSSYQEAVEVWDASSEIADAFARDGVRNAEQLSEGEIKDAIDDWKALKRMGL